MLLLVAGATTATAAATTETVPSMSPGERAIVDLFVNTSCSSASMTNASAITFVHRNFVVANRFEAAPRAYSRARRGAEGEAHLCACSSVKSVTNGSLRAHRDLRNTGPGVG